eukprot:SAG25_NODE_708_length_5832_cov_2.856794_1_plen_213_part_00
MSLLNLLAALDKATRQWDFHCAQLDDLVKATYPQFMQDSLRLSQHVQHSCIPSRQDGLVNLHRSGIVWAQHIPWPSFSRQLMSSGSLINVLNIVSHGALCLQNDSIKRHYNQCGAEAADGCPINTVQIADAGQHLQQRLDYQYFGELLVSTRQPYDMLQNPICRICWVLQPPQTPPHGSMVGVRARPLSVQSNGTLSKRPVSALYGHEGIFY